MRREFREESVKVLFWMSEIVRRSNFFLKLFVASSLSFLKQPHTSSFQLIRPSFYLRYTDDVMLSYGFKR